MRYRLITVDLAVVVELMKHDSYRNIKTMTEVPEDMKYVRAFVNDDSGWGRVGVVVESKTFHDLENGDIIPPMEILFEKT